MFEGIKNWIYQQYADDDYRHEYMSAITDMRDQFVGTKDDMLEYSQVHPILSGGLLFVCNLFAQAKFELQDRNGKVLGGNDNPILTLLDRPNYYQTRIDFLEALQWMKIVRGNAPVYFKKAVGFDVPDAMYVLDPYRIEWPDGFVTPLDFDTRDPAVANVYVKYKQTDDPRMDIQIQLKDIMFLFDMPNVKKSKNMFLTGSRIDGLKQTLDNTVDSLVAKNIILRSNGKEMLSADGGAAFPMDSDEKEEAKRVFNVGYGLTPNRSRAFITRSNVKWQSMHIALRDLGLDESTKVDGNIVFTALHIPKDIMSLEAKKTTYNNFKESMTSFIQNDMTTMLNDFVENFNVHLGGGIKLVGTYAHMPVMQHLRIEEYKVVNLQADALLKLRKAGVPDKEALGMAGMDETIQLEEYEQTGTDAQESAPSSNGEDSGEDA